jgi:hypothetical protein
MNFFAIWWIVFVNDEKYLGAGGGRVSTWKKSKNLNYLQILYSSSVGKQHKLFYFYLLFIGKYG